MIWNCDHFSKLNTNLHILENSYIFNNDQNNNVMYYKKEEDIFNNILLRKSFKKNYGFFLGKKIIKWLKILLVSNIVKSL
jgi:hypothetical protein